jgi:voltage-gated sodium channel
LLKKLSSGDHAERVNGSGELLLRNFANTNERQQITMVSPEKPSQSSAASSCQRTQTTEVYTISSDVPYRLALDEPLDGRNGNSNNRKEHVGNDNNNQRPHHNDVDFDLNSQKSWTSTYDGLDILGGEKPNNFNTWSQRRAAQIVNRPVFKRTALALIFVCSVLLAIRTVVPHWIIDRALDYLLVIFTVEVFLSLIFYQDQIFGWVVFDIILVLSSMFSGDRSVLVLRSFRLLRALRKASGVPALRWVVKAILRALPRLAIACGLMACSLLTFSIWFTSIFPVTFPRIDQSAFLLFQMSTGGLAWGDIASNLEYEHPTAWIPLVSFILVFRFVFWTLTIAVMCNAVFHANDTDQAWKSMERPNHTDDEISEVQRLERKVDDLQSTLSSMLQSQANLTESIHQIVKERSIAGSSSNETAK